MTDITVGGLVFSARTAGPADGPLVLLLHGFPETSASWTALLPVLADAGYRAVAPDQRGYSAGARPEGVDAYAVDALVGDVLGIATSLGADQFHLVGHDWGGGIGWYVAARHPDRVLSYTSLATPHPNALRAGVRGELGGDQPAKSTYTQFFRTVGVSEQTFLGPDGDGAGLRNLYEGQGIDEEHIEQYLQVLTQPGALTAALSYYRATDFADLPPCEPVAVPTLYIWGSEDMALGREAAEATADHVSGRYRFAPLDGASHWLPEHATNQVAPLLLEHLASAG